MPESKAVPLLTMGALLVLSVVAAFTANRIVGLDARITEALNSKDRKPMQTFTTKVTRSSTGDEVTVTTQRNDGESLADFVARHNAAADAMKAS